MLRSAPTHINTRENARFHPSKGNVFIDTHMSTHRSPRARKIVCTIGRVEGKGREAGGIVERLKFCPTDCLANIAVVNR